MATGAGKTIALLALTLVLPCAARAQARWLRDDPRFAFNWQELSPEERQRALDNLQRYNNLPEASRRRMDQSYESWQKLDPGERARVQQNYQKYRQMTPDQRRDFESRYRRWKGGQNR